MKLLVWYHFRQWVQGHLGRLLRSPSPLKPIPIHPSPPNSFQIYCIRPNPAKFHKNAPKSAQLAPQISNPIHSNPNRSAQIQPNPLTQIYKISFNLLKPLKSARIHSDPSKCYQIRRHSVWCFHSCVNTWNSFAFGRAVHSEWPFQSDWLRDNLPFEMASE